MIELVSGKPKEETVTKRLKTGSSAGCPYYKQDPIEDFKDMTLVEVKDIEQLIGLGRQLKACPYYGTRLAIPDAEVRETRKIYIFPCTHSNNLTKVNK